MSKQLKKMFSLLVLGILSSIGHNLYYALTVKEEAVMFFIAIGSLFLFSLSILFYTIKRVRKGEPKDLWKLGFLGFLGFIGFLLQPGGNLFGLFGFFGYFGFFRKAK